MGKQLRDKIQLVKTRHPRKPKFVTISGNRIEAKQVRLGMYPTRGGRHSWMDGTGTAKEGQRRKQFDRERARAKAARKSRVYNARRNRK